MKLERIHASPKTDVPPEFEKVFAVEIAPDRASVALQSLNAKYPLPEHLGHVKRIWRRCVQNETCVLLLLLGPLLGELLIEDWKVLISNFECPLKGQIRIELVPRRMPVNRVEFEKWRTLEYWPTTFHEQKGVMKAEEEELTLVAELAKLIAEHISHKKVIIIDPKRPEEEHWVTAINPERGSILERNSILDSPEKGSILDEPVMIAIRNMAAVHLLSGGIGKQSHDAQYLCTGFVAFCLDEPSIMAAMALVHSRIRIVAFINPDPKRGGICSVLSLQDVPETNHHFSVFKYHLETLLK